MKKNRLKTWLIIIFLALFGLNFTPVLAQVMEIEVLGGGYRLRGPDVIAFPNVTASLTSQQGTRDIRDLDPQNEEDAGSTSAKDYLAIEDQNGGNMFDVTVTSTNLADTASGVEIGSAQFFIKNKNGTGTDIIADNSFTNLTGVSLNSDTDSFTDLSVQRTLFSGGGRTPGAWRIFPVFRVDIPSGTPPGTYTGTLTFTII